MPSKGVVLDTSLLIDLLRSNEQKQAAVNRLIDEGYTLAISAASVAEVYAGIRIGEEPLTEQLLTLLNCVPLSIPIAKRAGELKAARSRVGRTHGLVDMMIAATAIEYGYSVATNDKRDFDLPGLRLISLS